MDGPDLNGMEVPLSLVGKFKRRGRLGSLAPTADGELTCSFNDEMAELPSDLTGNTGELTLDMYGALGGTTDSISSINRKTEVVEQGEEEDQSGTFIILYLLMLGLLMGLIAIVIDVVVHYMRLVHLDLLVIEGNFSASYFLYILWSVFFTMTSVLLTRGIDVAAVGSGIPEIKSILSGGQIAGYLNMRMWITKFFGLISVLSAGIYVGKEGPFTHLSCITAENLNKLRIFRVIRHDPTLRVQLLSVACAVGVAANFGTPFGAVLFAVEVTSSYYPIRDYYYSFVGTLPAIIILRLMIGILFNSAAGSFSFPTFYESRVPLKVGNADAFDIVACSFLFIVCGMASVMYIRWVRLVASAIARLRAWKPVLFNVYFYALAIALVSGIIGFPGLVGKFMGAGPVKVFESLIDPHPAAGMGWSNGSTASYIWHLALFFVAKTVMLPLSGAMSVPSGIYIPLLCVGGSLGRIIGEAVQLIRPSHSGSLSPAAYAILGASSFCGGVTHTLSTAMVILELIGQLDLVMPVFAGVLLSIGITKKVLGKSIYDFSAQDRDLPYIPDLKYNTYSMKARDLAEQHPSIPMRPRFTEIADCLEMLKQLTLGKSYNEIQTHGLHLIPVVKSSTDAHLMGAVPAAYLRKLYNKFHNTGFEQLGDLGNAAPRLGDSLYGSVLDQARITSNRQEAAAVGRSAMAGLEDDDLMSTALGGISNKMPSVKTERMKEALPVRSLPIRLMESTTIQRIHLMFVTMRLQVAFMCSDDGMLTGAVSRAKVANIDKYVEKPLLWTQMAQAFCGCCGRKR